MANLTEEQMAKRRKTNAKIFKFFGAIFAALFLFVIIVIAVAYVNEETNDTKQSVFTEQMARAELTSLLTELDSIRHTEEFKTSLYGKGIGAKWDAKRKILVEKIKEADLSFNLKLASTELWALGKAYVRNTDENPYTLRKEIEGYLQ